MVFSIFVNCATSIISSRMFHLLKRKSQAPWADITSFIFFTIKALVPLMNNQLFFNSPTIILTFFFAFLTFSFFCHFTPLFPLLYSWVCLSEIFLSESLFFLSFDLSFRLLFSFSIFLLVPLSPTHSFFSLYTDSVFVPQKYQPCARSQGRGWRVH